MSASRRQKRRWGRRLVWYVLGVVAVLALGTTAAVYLTGSRSGQPIILYVNQGNGIVNGSNFGSLISYASSHEFNTVFFQVYRQGTTLFSNGQLATFVNETHASNLKIFFALYITNSSQKLPTSLYLLGEDGMSLDASTLDLGTQEALLASLKASYHGETAVTTTNMGSPLKPDLLILETYGSGTQQYIRHGIIASVEVFATSSEQDYRSQFQYALENSDGVMVFDYAGLLKSGY
ncbi:MAG: hypothetical protein LYZ69_07865 [Nitrososphaerales archaeon]|nr:hypothetical protein [Nitrososphaerales archaeon]